MSEINKKLIVFTGPTGVGKTEIAIEYALRHNAEIVSADSMQIYKELNIGTAKPTKKEQQLVKHHLIDCWNAVSAFNLSEYIKLADDAISEIWNKGKNCLIVGGTGLYIEGLLKGIFTQPSKDINIRWKLNEKFKTHGAAYLYNELYKVDPIISKKIQPTDAIRIIRALEVFYVTGRPMSEWQSESRKAERRYVYDLIILIRDRKELYERIDKRVDMMFEKGLVDEVKSLLTAGLPLDCQAMKAVGYREITNAILTQEELYLTKEKVKKVSRNYAKRQLTWFRNRMPGTQINITQKTKENILDEIENLLEMRR